MTDWRGVPRFDFNMCLLLAHAPLDDAIAAFVKAFGGRVNKDVMGKRVRHRPPAYLAYQFKEHSWTIFDLFIGAMGVKWTTPEEIKRFSKVLGGKVLLFSISDMAGIYEYAMYEKGKLYERVFNRNAADGTKPYEQGFESPGRKARAPAPGKLLKFIDAFMREQDVLIPPFGSVARECEIFKSPGAATIQIEEEEFAPANVVRVDYISMRNEALT